MKMSDLQVTILSKTFAAETVTKIRELTEENSYALDDIHVFIDENSEKDFVMYYEDYVLQGEKVGYDVADAFIQEFGIQCIESCEKSYQGEYSSGGAFAEQFSYDMGYSIPDFVVIDWDETFDRNLYYDYLITDAGYVFHKHF